jgi:hypothetical protein
MENEKLKIFLDFSQFVVGTIGLGLVSTNINYHIQNREITIKEQASIGQFVQQALQEDVGVRRRFAKYFATVTRSDEMRQRWTAYSDNIEEEFNQKVKEQESLEKKAKEEKDPSKKAIILDNVQKIKVELSPKKTSSTTENPARVYFYFRNKEQSAKANNIANTLRESNYIVPEVSLTLANVNSTQLRYFNSTDKDEAESLTSFLKTKGIKAVSKYLKGYETTARPRLYELWLSPNE